jgi:hypothetical protein
MPYRFDASLRHPLSSYAAAGLSQQVHPSQDSGWHGSDLSTQQEHYPRYVPWFGL